MILNRNFVRNAYFDARATDPWSVLDVHVQYRV